MKIIKHFLAVLGLALLPHLAFAQGGCGGMIEQGTAYELKIGPFVDDSDGATPMTGLTLSQADFRLAKQAGDWAQSSDATAATHEENGWYRKPLSTTDTNTLRSLVVAVNETGALPVWCHFWIVPAATLSWYDGSIITNAAIADAVLDEACAGHLAAGSFGQSLCKVSGTSDSGTTLTMVDAARTEATTDYFGQFTTIIRFTSGPNVGLSRIITGFTPATDTTTFVPALPASVTTETYVFEPFGHVSPGSATITAATIAGNAITASNLDPNVATELQVGVLIIPRNTAFPDYPIRMRTAAGVAVTGQDVKCDRQLAGGAFADAAANVSATEIGNGFYELDLLAGDLNSTRIIMDCRGTGGSGTSVPYEQFIFTNH